MLDGTVDAVIAWVDGSDPAHAAKRAAALARLGLSVDTNLNFAAPTRFSDLGEIYWCIASILKYAPFIRRIHIVADDQRPAALDAFCREGICGPERIDVVDHRSLFRGHEDCLPTFNCRTIESLSWRIDGVAEHVLYFNDDFFLNGPLSAGDLLTDDGKLRLEGKLAPVGWTLTKHRLRKTLAALRGRRQPTGYKLAQAQAAQLVGHRRYLSTAHIPHLLRSATLRDYFAAHPERLARQLSHQFRSVEQFSPWALSNELERAAGRAVVTTPRPSVYLTPQGSDDLSALSDERIRYGCVQSLDLFAPEKRTRLRAAMQQKLAGYLPRAVTGG